MEIRKGKLGEKSRKKEETFFEERGFAVGEKI